MARRCPDAIDPRPATLADHDWLINERGVATVEPFDGSEVHGVLWQVTDHDLATLDSAEGVPVRYRRDRMTVHTDDGPVGGVGLHRPPRRTRRPATRLPGTHHRRRRAPRPAAPLDRIPAAAGIPRTGPRVSTRSRFGCAAVTFGAARRSRRHRGQHAAVAVRVPGHPRWRAGADDRRHRRARRRRRRRVGVRACATPTTIRTTCRRRCTAPQESERLAEFLDHVDVVVSLHGYGRIGRSTQLLAGGGNRTLAAHLARHVVGAGLPGRHRPRRHPARAARPAPRQPGQPGRAAAAHSSN